MEFRVCAQCGKDIEGEGIPFHKKYFCSDKCCDEYEELLLSVKEPVPAELDGDEVGDFVDLVLEADVDLDDLEDLDLDLDDDDF